MQNTRAKTLAGFMELEPKKQILFTKMQNIIETVFQKYGLTPMDTPILEYSDVLLAKAGGETEKQIYRFNKGDNDLCMRFDLTVPFAKYSALQQNNLVFPFKRYQIGKVFRGERAQKGRFREFIQCDVDIISDFSLSQKSDAECIAILSDVYKNLNVNILIKISNRKIWKGVLQEFNLDNNTQVEVLNILDKKDKVGDDKTIELLNAITKNSLEIIKISKINSIEKLKELQIKNQTFALGLQELQDLFSALKVFELQNDYVLDLGVVRGLDYYTGIVFEAVLQDIPEKSSIGGGGHYENLASNYTNQKLDGVGASIGLTRVFDLLDQNSKLNFDNSTTATVAILPLGDTFEYCAKISKILREKNINNTILYFDKAFKYKLNYANKIGVPFIIVIGEDEVNAGEFGLKNMKTGEVFEGNLKDIIKRLEQ